MAPQRDRLFEALGEVVARVDDLDSLVPILQQLGRDHRKFGTVYAHYPAVGASLLATTLAALLGGWLLTRVWLALGEHTPRFAAAAEAAGVMVRSYAADGVRISIGEPAGNDVVLQVAGGFEPKV